MENKFILKIEFTGNLEYGLEITIMHWDKRYLAYPGKEKDQFTYHMYDGFIMYSCGNGKISNTNIFVFPSLNHFYKNYKLSCNFYSEKDRYNYLKSLFYCLQDWAKKENELNKRREPIFNSKMIVCDKYWTM